MMASSYRAHLQVNWSPICLHSPFAPFSVPFPLSCAMMLTDESQTKPEAKQGHV